MDKVAPPKVAPPEIEKVAVKYVLCRRINHLNEVVQAGPKAASASGLVDFHTFLKDHGLHHLELAQILKISYSEMEKLNEHGGWIELPAKENLLQLLRNTCARSRRELCQFLIIQEGGAGSANFPHSQDFTPHQK